MQVAAANAGLRVHAVVQRLLNTSSPTLQDSRAAVDQLTRDPTFDAHLLDQIQRHAFHAQLHQVCNGVSRDRGRRPPQGRF